MWAGLFVAAIERREAFIQAQSTISLIRKAPKKFIVYNINLLL